MTKNILETLHRVSKEQGLVCVRNDSGGWIKSRDDATFPHIHFIRVGPNFVTTSRIIRDDGSFELQEQAILANRSLNKSSELRKTQGGFYTLKTSIPVDQVSFGSSLNGIIIHYNIFTAINRNEIH